MAHLPSLKPGYRDHDLSPYDHVYRIGPNERQDRFHYAHRLSGASCNSLAGSRHPYCLAAGQTSDEFRADLQAARRDAEELGITLKRLVFPRNQWRPDYLAACADAGIRVVRGPRQAWMYRPESSTHSAIKRAFRLVDTYVSLSGHNCHSPVTCEAGLINAPASRFLRPFSPKLERLTPLSLRRIRSGMKQAASSGLTYHLWWHPHNSGSIRNKISVY